MQMNSWYDTIAYYALGSLSSLLTAGLELGFALNISHDNVIRKGCFL